MMTRKEIGVKVGFKSENFGVDIGELRAALNKLPQTDYMIFELTKMDSVVEVLHRTKPFNHENRDGAYEGRFIGHPIPQTVADFLKYMEDSIFHHRELGNGTMRTILFLIPEGIRFTPYTWKEFLRMNEGVRV